MSTLVKTTLMIIGLVILGITVVYVTGAKPPHNQTQNEAQAEPNYLIKHFTGAAVIKMYVATDVTFSYDADRITFQDYESGLEHTIYGTIEVTKLGDAERKLYMDAKNLKARTEKVEREKGVGSI